MRQPLTVSLFLLLLAALVSPSVDAANFTRDGITYTSTAQARITGTARRTAATPPDAPCFFKVTNCRNSDQNVAVVIEATLGDRCDLIIEDNFFYKSVGIVLDYIEQQIPNNDSSIIFRRNTLVTANITTDKDALTFHSAGGLTKQPPMLGTSSVQFCDNTFRYENTANSAGTDGIAAMLVGAFAIYWPLLNISSNVMEVQATSTVLSTTQWWTFNRHWTSSNREGNGAPQLIMRDNKFSSYQGVQHSLLTFWPGPGCTPCDPSNAMSYSKMEINNNEMSLFAATVDSVVLVASNAASVSPRSINSDFIVSGNTIRVTTLLTGKALIIQCQNCSAQNRLMVDSNTILVTEARATLGVLVAVAWFGNLNSATPSTTQGTSFMLSVFNNKVTVEKGSSGFLGALIVNNIAVTTELRVRSNRLVLTDLDVASSTLRSNVIVCVLCFCIPRIDGAATVVRPGSAASARFGTINVAANELVTQLSVSSAAAGLWSAQRIITLVYVDTDFSVMSTKLAVDSNEVTDLTAAGDLSESIDSVSAICFWCDSQSGPAVGTRLAWAFSVATNTMVLSRNSNITLSLLRASATGVIPAQTATAAQIAAALMSGGNLVYGNTLRQPNGVSYGITDLSSVSPIATTALRFAFASCPGAVSGAATVAVAPAVGGKFSVGIFDKSLPTTSCNKLDFTAPGTPTQPSSVSLTGVLYLRSQVVAAAIRDSTLVDSNEQCGQPTTTSTTTTTTTSSSASTTTTATTVSAANSTATTASSNDTTTNTTQTPTATNTTQTPTSTSAATTTSTTTTIPTSTPQTSQQQRTRTRQHSITVTRIPAPYEPPGLPAAQQQESLAVSQVSGVVAGAFVSPAAAMSVSRGMNIFMLAGCPALNPDGEPWSHAFIAFPESIFPGVGVGWLTGGYARGAIFSFMSLFVFAVFVALMLGFVSFFGARSCLQCVCCANVFNLEWWRCLLGVSPVPHVVGLITAQIVGFWFRSMGVLIGGAERSFVFLDAVVLSLFPAMIVGYCWFVFFRNYNELLTANRHGTSRTFGIVTSVAAEQLQTREQRYSEFEREEEAKMLQRLESEYQKQEAKLKKKEKKRLKKQQQQEEQKQTEAVPVPQQQAEQQQQPQENDAAAVEAVAGEEQPPQHDQDQEGKQPNEKPADAEAAEATGAATAVAVEIKEDQQPPQVEPNEQLQHQPEDNNNDEDDEESPPQPKAKDTATTTETASSSEEIILLPSKWKRLLLRLMNNQYIGRFCLMGDATWESTTVGSRSHVMLNRSFCIIARVWGNERLVEKSTILDKKQRKKISKAVVADIGFFRDQSIIHQHVYSSSAGCCARVGCFEGARMRWTPHSFSIGLILAAISGLLTGIAQTRPETCPNILIVLALLNTFALVVFVWLRPSVIPLVNWLNFFMDVITMLASIIVAKAAREGTVAGSAEVQMMTAVVLTGSAMTLLICRFVRFLVLSLIGAAVMPLHVYEKQLFELYKREKARKQRLKDLEQEFWAAKNGNEGEKQQEQQQQQTTTSTRPRADSDLVPSVKVESPREEQQHQQSVGGQVDSNDQQDRVIHEEQEQEELDENVKNMRGMFLAAAANNSTPRKFDQQPLLSREDWAKRFEEIDRGMRITHRSGGARRAAASGGDDNDDDGDDLDSDFDEAPPPPPANQNDQQELVQQQKQQRKMSTAPPEKKAASHYRKELDELFPDL